MPINRHQAMALVRRLVESNHMGEFDEEDHQVLIALCNALKPSQIVKPLTRLAQKLGVTVPEVQS